LKGTPRETMTQLKDFIRRQKPKCIISVGDVVSQNMLSEGIQPQIIIIDGKVMRKETQPIKVPINRKICVENPAGMITPQAWGAVERAVRQKQQTLIKVEGEEDLMTLLAVLKAPEGWLVVYGQPREGVVAIKVDATAKRKASRIIEAMEPLPKS